MALINWHNKINSWSDFKNLLDTKTKQENIKLSFSFIIFYKKEYEIK